MSTPLRISFNTELFGNSGLTVKLDDNLYNEKKIFTTVYKMDQVNQYGFAMTKSLPKAGIRKVKLPIDFDIDEFLQEYDEHGTVGSLFCVDIESSEADDINMELNGQYCAFFCKEEVPVSHLSPYQLYIKKRIGKNGKALKIHSTAKLISSMGKHLNAYLYAETLIFLKSVGWKITAVKERFTFLQSKYLKDYVTSNQNERKKAKNTVESDTYKAMNNHLYGWLLRNSLNSSKLTPLIDYVKEADDWMADRGSAAVMANNPFGGARYRKSKLQAKYDEDMSRDVDSEFQGAAAEEARKELIEENFTAQMDIVNAQIKMEVKNHQKMYPTKPTDIIIEALDSDKVKSVVKIKTCNSISGYVLEDKTKVKSNTRFIGSKVLAFAKIFIAGFVHKVIKVFHELTINDSTKQKLIDNKIEEVKVIMSLTDTDSASFQFITVCGEGNAMVQNEVDDLIMKILIVELKDCLDLSDPYFEKFNSRTPHTKKQMGLFAFEQIGKKITLCLATNPKEYVEICSELDSGGDASNTSNFKHKGIRKDSKGMTVKEYSKRLENLSALKSDQKAFSSSKIVQTRIKKAFGDINMISLSKIALSQLNDKVYYFENGLMSLTHHHPDLAPIYELRNGKTVDELLSAEVEEKTLEMEEKIVNKSKKFKYYSSIMNHVLPNGLTVKKQLLEQ